MRGIQFIPAGTRVPFMRFHKLFLGFSAFVVIASILLVLFDGLNFGIDFRGGILLDVKTQGPADIPAMRQTLSALDLGEVGLQEFGSPDNVLIRLQRQEGEEAEQTAAINRVKEALGAQRRVPSHRARGAAGERRAVSRRPVRAWPRRCCRSPPTFGFASNGSSGSPACSPCCTTVIAIVGVFALLGYEFNLTIVAAILTIAGYSINDSVVVFDRIRENMRKYKTMPFIDLIDLSINQTLSRTFITGLTTIIVLIVLYVLGGEVLRGFSFAMLFGVIIGTYSSVFVAVPLLLYLDVRRAPAGAEATVREQA